MFKWAGLVPESVQMGRFGSRECSNGPVWFQRVFKWAGLVPESVQMGRFGSRECSNGPVWFQRVFKWAGLVLESSTLGTWATERAELEIWISSLIGFRRFPMYFMS